MRIALACAPAVAPQQLSGAGMLLDFTPANRPALIGALDFELLASGAGAACADRGSAVVGRGVRLIKAREPGASEPTGAGAAITKPEPQPRSP